MDVIEIKDAVNKENIYIYGASKGGTVVCKLLRIEGIEPKGFYDARKEIYEWAGLPVKHSEDFDPINDTVIIAAARSFQSACKTLEDAGFSIVYKCANIVQNYSQSHAENRNLLPDESSFLRDYPLYANGFFYGNNIVLPVLEVFITEICTLRCRDCSHLIPYYEKPSHYNIDSIISNLMRILQVVDEIKEVVILGGEPLLHSKIDRLINWCGTQKEIGIVRVLTNGTVVPTEKVLKSLSEVGGEIRISDYSKLSTKIEECKTVCKEYKVPCFVQYEPWLDMGDSGHHSYNMSELKEMFIQCPFTFVFLLLKDRIYRCAHIAHLNNQGHIDTNNHDSIVLSEDRNDDNLKSELTELFNIGYMEGCQWCNGFCDSTLLIEPAIQIEKAEKVVNADNVCSRY